MPGTALVGATYPRPFDLVDAAEFGAGRHRVVAADYVTADSGTGLVHLAPAFGAEDWARRQAARWPRTWSTRSPPPVASRTSVPLVGGLFFKDADTVLIEDMRERGRLWRLAPTSTRYPSCWRCHTPLIYYALPSWYIRTTAVKDRLLAQNEATGWFPAAHQARPLWRMAQQQHRLGAVPQPVLGHSPAGVAVHGR